MTENNVTIKNEMNVLWMYGNSGVGHNDDWWNGNEFRIINKYLYIVR